MNIEHWTMNKHSAMTFLASKTIVDGEYNLKQNGYFRIGTDPLGTGRCL
jgi:hypothetical protein